MYTYTQQYRNSTYMKFSLQATLKWAAQRMHSKVIRLIMHNANSGGESLCRTRSNKTVLCELGMVLWCT